MNDCSRSIPSLRKKLRKGKFSAIPLIRQARHQTTDRPRCKAQVDACSLNDSEGRSASLCARLNAAWRGFANCLKLKRKLPCAPPWQPNSLLDLLSQLRFIDQVILVNIQIAHIRLLGFARRLRLRMQRRAIEKRHLHVAAKAMETEEPARRGAVER